MGEDTRKMTATVMMVLLIGVILVVGIYILAQTQTVFMKDAAGTFTAETLSSVTAAGVPLTVSGVKNSCQITSLTAVSASNGSTISALSYTYSGCVVYATGGVYNNSNWNVTGAYSFKDTSAASNASGDSISALSNGGPWLTIIIVVAFAIIVLGFLTSGFKRAENEGQLAY